jgi:hypothetical protein
MVVEARFDIQGPPKGGYIILASVANSSHDSKYLNVSKHLLHRMVVLCE